MIDDYIMSTQVPSEVPLDGNMDLDSLTLAIRHAKICSRVANIAGNYVNQGTEIIR
jgi:hypothetical protein